MNQATLYQRNPSEVPAAIFMYAGLFFAISLFCPVVEHNRDSIPGWGAVYMTASISATGLWYSITHRASVDLLDIVPMLLGTAANFSLLVTAAGGWKLHRKHAVPMLALALNGLAAGLVVPYTLYRGPFFSPDAMGMYLEVQAGYWLWLICLILVALAWALIVRDRWWMKRSIRDAIE